MIAGVYQEGKLAIMVLSARLLCAECGTNVLKLMYGYGDGAKRAEK